MEGIRHVFTPSMTDSIVFIFLFCFILLSILQQHPPSLLLKDQTQYNPVYLWFLSVYCTQCKKCSIIERHIYTGFEGGVY